MGNRVDQRIKVESWQIRILSFDEHNIRSVVPKKKEELAKVFLPWPNLNASLFLSSTCVPTLLPGEVDMVWKVVVQVRESNLVFCADRLPDDDLINIIEFIPVFIPKVQNQR